MTHKELAIYYNRRHGKGRKVTAILDSGKIMETEVLTRAYMFHGYAVVELKDVEKPFLLFALMLTNASNFEELFTASGSLWNFPDPEKESRKKA